MKICGQFAILLSNTMGGLNYIKRVNVLLRLILGSKLGKLGDIISPRALRLCLFLELNLDTCYYIFTPKL